MEQKLIKKKNAKISGFTLIEMVVVIGVIGVLMTLAFRGTATIQGGARDVKRVKTLNDMKAFLEQYYASEGKYPETGFTTTCNPDDTQTATNRWALVAGELVTKRIIDKATDIADDPTKANQLCYSAAVGGTSYRMTAILERSVPKDHVTDTGGITITGCQANAADTTYYCTKP